MTNSDAMARWGIPDWTNAAAFPQQATDSVGDGNFCDGGPIIGMPGNAGKIASWNKVAY